MNALTIWIILGVVHVMLTTLFIIKGEDWFLIHDYVIYIVAPITSTLAISFGLFILFLLIKAQVALLGSLLFFGLPIGLAWLITKVRR